jgi:hypothetical protein
MKNLPTVACVMRSGGIYDPAWVRRLKYGVESNTTIPHRFVCLSDIDIPGVETIPLKKHRWSGWWSKIELFRPELFTGTVLYIDLDSIIVSDLSPLLEYPHEFTMAHNWGISNRDDTYQSSVMAWNGDWSAIYHMFKQNPSYYMKKLKGGKGGDQEFIPRALAAMGKKPQTFKECFSEKIVASYKVHKCKDGPPSESCIVTFHGKGKEEFMSTGWTKDSYAGMDELLLATALPTGKAESSPEVSHSRESYQMDHGSKRSIKNGIAGVGIALRKYISKLLR